MFITPSTIYRGLTSENAQTRRWAREEMGRLFAPYVHQWAERKTNDSDLADDIRQEVLLEVIIAIERRGLKPRERPGQLRAFLKKIAARTLDKLLRKRYRSKLSFVENPEDLLTTLEDAADDYVNQLELIDNALERIENPVHREIFRARHAEGRSPREIADEYQMHPDKVYHILNNVKDKIKKSLRVKKPGRGKQS